MTGPTERPPPTDAERAERAVLSTTVGELPLAEYHLTLAGHAWKVLHTGAIVSHAEEQDFLHGDHPKLPYGLALWPSAIALAHEIAGRPLAGLRVLELGAGTGLPGIVAATLGAHVVQTDRQEVALHLSRMNAERNAVPRIEHRVADWTRWEDSERYDVILGADILYGDFLHPSLRAIFLGNLVPGGKVLVADPYRQASFTFLEQLESEGWKVTFNKWTVSVTPPERPVGVFELTRGG